MMLGDTEQISAILVIVATLPAVWLRPPSPFGAGLVCAIQTVLVLQQFNLSPGKRRGERDGQRGSVWRWRGREEHAEGEGEG